MKTKKSKELPVFPLYNLYVESQIVCDWNVYEFKCHPITKLIGILSFITVLLLFLI